MWTEDDNYLGSVPRLIGPPVPLPAYYKRRPSSRRAETEFGLGYDPRYGGLAIMPDGRCFQGGIEVSCVDESPVYVPPSPGTDELPTGGIKCPRGTQLVNGQCVSIGNNPVDPLPPVGPNYCVPGRPYRSPTCVCPPGYTWNTSKSTCVPVAAAKPKPIVVKPPIQVQPIVPAPTSPVWRRRRKWRPKPRQAPIAPVVQAAAAPSSTCAANGQICPARGWVSCPIPGVNEYQTMACTPGSPVVINEALRSSVRSEAIARSGLAGLDGLGSITIGNIDVPMWALAVAGGLALFVFSRKGRR